MKLIVLPSKFSSNKKICSLLPVADKSIMFSSPHISGLGLLNVNEGTFFIVAITAVLNNDSQFPFQAVT